MRITYQVLRPWGFYSLCKQQDLPSRQEFVVWAVSSLSRNQPTLPDLLHFTFCIELSSEALNSLCSLGIDSKDSGGDVEPKDNTYLSAQS